jgi:hypothetical protein
MGWTGWSEVPGGGRTPSPPSATIGNLGDPLNLYVRGTDDGIYATMFTGTDWLPHWYELPGAARTPSGPAATGEAGGNMMVSIRKADDTIFVNSHQSTFVNNQPLGWQGWKEVGGGGRTKSQPAALLDLAMWPPVWFVFVRGTDDIIYRNGLSADRAGADWWGWKAVSLRSLGGGGIAGEGKTRSAPAVTQWGGDLHLIVRGVDDSLRHNVSADGSVWRGWRAVGGNTLDAPAVAKFDDAVHLVVRGTDDGLHHNVFDGDEWRGWDIVPEGRTPSAPALTVYAGDLWLFVRATDDGIYFNRYESS